MHRFCGTASYFCNFSNWTPCVCGYMWFVSFFLACWYFGLASSLGITKISWKATCFRQMRFYKTLPIIFLSDYNLIPHYFIGSLNIVMSITNLSVHSSIKDSSCRFQESGFTKIWYFQLKLDAEFFQFFVSTIHWLERMKVFRINFLSLK